MLQLRRETRTNSGFRSVVPLDTSSPRVLRYEVRTLRRKFGAVTLKTFVLYGVGRVLSVTGDGWRCLYYR